jgi:hypothetical protein
MKRCNEERTTQLRKHRRREKDELEMGLIVGIEWNESRDQYAVFAESARRKCPFVDVVEKRYDGAYAERKRIK